MTHCLAQLDRFERHGRRACFLMVHTKYGLRVGPQARMGSRVEADFFVSPSPPLHVLGGIHNALSDESWIDCQNLRSGAFMLLLLQNADGIRVFIVAAI